MCEMEQMVVYRVYFHSQLGSIRHMINGGEYCLIGSTKQSWPYDSALMYYS